MTDKIHISADTFEAAADWLLMIDEDPNVRVSEAFERWLYASPSHLQAFVEVSRSWDAVAPERLGYIAHVLVAVRKVASLRQRALFPSRHQVGFALAGVAALVCAAIIYMTQAFPTGAKSFYHAEVGEIRSIELADYSVLYLDTDTSAAVEHSSDSRIVTLEYGRVFVDVNGADPRVFKVMTGPLAFTATGTAYSVLTQPGGYCLEVYEGTVEIRRDQRLLGTFHAGEGAQVLGYAVNRFDVSTSRTEQPDWTRNRVVFEGTPLAEAVAKFNRYSHKKIVLSAFVKHDMPVTGTFALNDVDAFLGSVEVILGANIRETDNKVLIE
ncbi:FecR family protein [Kordiimonas sp.]|uniref:FecR family protein n=1 Tax=Kordiimonas sp. TaxID=1970157 RepID=UPI003A90758F